jgi:hypothetical protein
MLRKIIQQQFPLEESIGFEGDLPFKNRMPFVTPPAMSAKTSVGSQTDPLIHGRRNLL